MNAATRRTTLRGLLAGAAAAALAPAAGATAAATIIARPPGGESPGEDAELVALADEFHAIDAQLMAWNRRDDISDDVFAREHSKWWAILDRTIELPAATDAGRRAKASILPAVIRDCLDEGRPVGLLTLSLVRDLTSEASSAQSGHHGPDTHFIIDCDRMTEIQKEMKAIVEEDGAAPGEGPHHAHWVALQDELDALESKLWEADEVPGTLAGARALARTAWADAPRTDKGELCVTDFGEWMKLTAIAWLAGENAA